MAKSLMKIVSIFPIVFLLLSFSSKPLSINLDLNSKATQIVYAIEKFDELQTSKLIRFSESNPDLTVRATLDSLHLKPEAYKMVSNQKLVTITGGDAVGLMYGLLEVKNQLKAGVKIIESKDESPNLAFRAIKFNLPWSTYRNSEALSLHFETCRDTTYWESYEVTDMKAWANLGLYFSNKLRAAVEYKLFKLSKSTTDLDASIAYLTSATNNWHAFVDVTKPVYKPVPLVHFAYNDKGDQLFHWSIIEKQGKEEMEWLKLQR